MKHVKFLTIALAFTALCSTNCTQKLLRYTPREALPRMIYLESEVHSLRADSNSLEGKQMYVELRTKQGGMESGRLVEITEEDIVLAPGFYYTAVNDSVRKVVPRVAVPKGNVFLLKVW
jgi:hypothetical protein